MFGDQMPRHEMFFYLKCFGMILLFLCGLAIYLTRRSIVKGYLRRHEEKLRRGLKIAEVKQRISDGRSDWQIFYSDNSTIYVVDDWQCPKWARKQE